MNTLFFAGAAIPVADCSDGDLRLVGGANASEGRLEICINRAWGTVCDNFFDDVDASVACDQLEGFQRDGESSSTTARGLLHIIQL